MARPVRERGLSRRPWGAYVDSYYLNVPRLLTIAERAAYHIPLPMNGAFTELRSMPHPQLMRLRDEFEKFIVQVKPRAFRLRDVTAWSDVPVRSLLSFDHVFSPRGVPDIFHHDGPWPPEGRFGILCRKVAGMELQVIVDPAWIISNSGALYFRWPRTQFQGLAAVRTVDHDGGVVVATALVLG